MKTDTIYKILRKLGLKFRGRRIIYTHQVALFRIVDWEKQILITKGVSHGYSLSPVLFKTDVEEAMKNVKEV